MIAAVLSGAIMASATAFADYDDYPNGAFYYANITRSTSALAGAVAETPAEYKFTVEGQEFILLDKAKKGTKTYFFVMSEGLYGTHPYSTATHEPYGWFNPEDTSNVAYWLNNDFWNTTGYVNPSPDTKAARRNIPSSTSCMVPAVTKTRGATLEGRNRSWTT